MNYFVMPILNETNAISKTMGTRIRITPLESRIAHNVAIPEREYKIGIAIFMR